MADPNPALDMILEADVHGYDIDGVLVNSFPVIFEAFNTYTRDAYGVSLPESFVRKHIMPGTPEEMVESFAQRLKDVHGMDMDLDVVSEVPRWIAAYEACDMSPEVYPGAVEMLALSKRLGKSVPVITSAPIPEVENNVNALEQRARALGIEGSLWDTIVTYEDIKQSNGHDLGKPNLRPMEIALERMGLSPKVSDHRMLYVGDSASDVMFAKNLGAVGVFLKTNTTESDILGEMSSQRPDLVFKDIQGFYSALSSYASEKR